MSNEIGRRVRKDWLKRAGSPSQYGIELNITTSSDAQFKLTDYHIRGVVDVPSRPLNDDERMALARVLLSHAYIPDRSKRRFRLLGWERTEGGQGVKVQQCGEILLITPKNIIPGSLRVYEAPEYEEPKQGELPGDVEHATWQREYQNNSYCRFESRKDLHQRWQDIYVNTQVLTPSGDLTLTRDASWYRLSQHVLDELFARGQPMSATNMHPSVDSATPFIDERLCKKAAEVVAAQGSHDQVFVKYGQFDHMKDLYERGIVWISSADDLNQQTHNQAVRDDERSFVVKGGIHPIDSTGGVATSRSFFTKQNAPEDFSRLVRQGDIQFVRMFDAPELELDQGMELRVRMGTDYWTYCLSELLDPRMFSDFEANACLIIKMKPFFERLVRMMRFVKPGAQFGFGRVTYDDPLGAYTTTRPAYVSPERVPMTKLFRYAYQREIRFVWLPTAPKEKLGSFELPIGPLCDFAELLECNL